MEGFSQKLTQPFEDPRRLGKNISDVTEDDASEVICLLHPNSPAAFDAVKATMLTGPQHILQNDDLVDITEDDIYMNPALSAPRELALRLSSLVKSPEDGFRFGRNPASCDVLLVPDRNDKLVSNIHFKIYVNSQGSLMIQDTSTNGTVVDGEGLRQKGKGGRLMPKPATRTLKNGSIICVISGREQEEIKLLVRIPARNDHEDQYTEKLRRYLLARGKVPQFASIRENSFGNQWNGGALYNFTGLLGKGAFATVYRIQTKNDGTFFAAKELDKRRFVKNGILDLKFDSELKIMQNLKHPNIVEYIDCQTHGNYIYIIMEYVQYGELSKDLQDRKFLPEHEVQQIARQTVRALNYLHRRNITHRDIKPDNILIKSRNPLVVKLSDFGLSKCVTDQETFLKTFCGTLLYCAPEVYPGYARYMQGHGPKRRRAGEPAPRTSPYDQSVDMWSFGAVLFHLLSGKAPILGKGDDQGAQMLSNIMTKAIDFQPLRDRGVSKEAIDFVSLLLNRNPLLRPTEAACLSHPWLLNVPDVLHYQDEQPTFQPLAQGLEIVQESEEDMFDDDDQELIEGLQRLTQQPGPSSEAFTSSPERPVKKPRTFQAASPFDQVQYPPLPPLGEQESDIVAPPPGGRLFGEITPSVLRSSGVFGHRAALEVSDTGSMYRESPQPNVPGTLPMYRESPQLPQVSVNDFVTFPTASRKDNADILEHSIQGSHDIHGLPDKPGSAASLFGAEEQIEQLQMGSPEAALPNVGTPDTTNPVTPATRGSSQVSVGEQPAIEEEDHETPHDAPLFTRNIDLALLNDTEAFEKSIKAREASRAANLMRAQTFAGRATSTGPPSIELARTIDARTGKEVDADVGRFIVADEIVARTINTTKDREQPQSASGQLTSSSTSTKRYGRLTSVAGSFAEVNIDLVDRMTSWGRGLDCTGQYPDKQDTRVPKLAMRITFWAPGLEDFVDQGGDWTAYPGIMTTISTGASGSILVNDVELRREAADGSAALWGKLYTGDVITIYSRGKHDAFLKFRVEILFGDSARPRPEAEEGFRVKKETYHHRNYLKDLKERESMRLSGKENEPVTGTTTDAVST